MITLAVIMSLMHNNCKLLTECNFDSNVSKKHGTLKIFFITHIKESEAIDFHFKE